MTDPTPEQRALIVRTLAEQVMEFPLQTGPPHPQDEYPVYQLTRRSEIVIWIHLGSHGKLWNPTTSRDDMAEVEARLTDAQWDKYTRTLGEAWVLDESTTDPCIIRWLLTAAPLTRAVCLSRSMGVEI